ncbi:hypothetical protein HPB47_007158 [Ixodes persulcatus]|uniref:Uncharacterized protein n=1 Tax=Ixodes persulcatus TaxID=34615 RepID=A0AC60P8D5_IXOPE|nr:hypothetical protein HPB47_007158 [Ixodes persulcatus]
MQGRSAEQIARRRTMCRGLGIPARAVTNYYSAHDTHSSLTVDQFYDEKGQDVEKMNTDSIWNFHVWTEVWMARPDLEPGDYIGWQVIDATPQEKSDDHGLRDPEVRSLRHGDPSLRIGQRISTKAVGCWDREDLTDSYKQPETQLVALPIAYEDYARHLYSQCLFNICTIASIREVKYDYIAQHDFMVRLPQVKINNLLGLVNEALFVNLKDIIPMTYTLHVAPTFFLVKIEGEPVSRKMINVTAGFINPLPKDLNGGFFMIEGPGLVQPRRVPLGRLQPAEMPEQGDVVTILHFNDCYNVEEQHGEPVGGASRFCTALKGFSAHNPLILFSGDVLAPSFNFGVDNLTEFAKQTKFPWLMSNVVDNETGKLLADGEEFQILERSGKKIGLIGLVEEEWLATLATLDPDDVEYKDFVTEGRRLARFLKHKKGVDYVIALTHMRTPNDCRLAANVDEIDLILGGHDHVYEIKKVNGKYIVKSGTDFRQFSHITLSFTTSGVTVNIVEVNVTSAFEEDKELKELLLKYKDVVHGKMEEVIGHFAVDLDGRFSSIRTSETNLGNFISDVMLSSTHSDLAILNAGTLRSDRIHPRGAFTMRDLVTILPMIDSLIVLSATGDQVLQALENGVSQYPKLEGRFPQVSGVTFAFDPKKPPGQRIDPQFVRIGDEPLDKTQMSEDESPELCTAVQNHFQAIKILTGVARPRTHHRQSLVCLSRRHSLVRTCEDVSVKAPLKRGLSLDASARRGLFRQRQASLEDVEHETCKMEPKVENRIVILTEEVEKKFRQENEIHPLSLVEEVIEEEPASSGSFEKN